MKAAVVTGSGLVVQDAPEPKPKPNEILVRVKAASLNRADLAVASGHAHGAIGGPGTIPGLEWAGEIVEAGAEVRGFKVGDRVMCSGSGGYAEYAATDFGRCSPVPAGMSFETATTLPMALQTMHDAVVTNGRLQPGETIMVQGASSGVGLMALQIARRRGASIVIGTSTNADRRARLAEFGATHTLDTSDPAWPDRVLEITGGKGVNVIIDQVSASVANGNMRAAAVLGRVVNVGRLGGATGEFDYDLHALKRISYIGVTFRTRSVEEVREINRKMREDLWDAVGKGELRLPVDRSFRLDDVKDALAHMKSNGHFGKVLLVP
ncbi:quinone oxidoreductase family protein [Enterovirga sp. CN4-39]|uniref:quinone oxidoreductase family protein n=1 Tax=Enterovirga sp. CN4-39 TaxID=3400910 RepID=UPI003C0486E7